MTNRLSKQPEPIAALSGDGCHHLMAPLCAKYHREEAGESVALVHLRIARVRALVDYCLLGAMFRAREHKLTTLIATNADEAPKWTNGKWAPLKGASANSLRRVLESAIRAV